MKFYLSVFLICMSTISYAKDTKRKIATESDKEMIQLFDDYFQDIELLYQSKQPAERVSFNPVHDKVRSLWFTLRTEFIQGRSLTDFGCQNEAEKAKNTNIFVRKISAMLIADPAMSSLNKDKMKALRNDAHSLLKKQFGDLTNCFEKQIVAETPTDKIDFNSIKQEFESLKK